MARRLMIAFALVACGDNRVPPTDTTRCATVAGDNLTLRQIAWGCKVANAPAPPDCMDGVVTLVTSPPRDPRLFALELNGRIRIIDHDQLRPEPFLDLSDDARGPVLAGGEQGLLGLAFHPQFDTNREFFVDYTARNPDTTDVDHPYLDVLARYTASADDPDKADPNSGVVVLAIPDPYANHNGGMIEFGADGYLYISEGDGGGVNGEADKFGYAQNPNALLGKMLRIDVDRKLPGKEYGIPRDNPFADGGGAPEVYIIGLRNPWRWSFDRANGDMWIADVGAATWEEIDYLPAGHQAGANLGWSMYEGTSCFRPPCDPTGKTFPIDEHHHATGFWAIIGGQVYRGSCYPDLVGTYLFTDCGYSQLLKAHRTASPNTLAVATAPDNAILYPASLHADSRGELYETDVEGNVFQLVVVP